MKKTAIVLISGLVLLTPAASMAGFLNGLIDALNGFPASYTDSNGLSLQPCLDTSGACGPAAEVPTTFPTPFPVVYYNAIARMYTYGGKGGNPDAARPGGQSTGTLIMSLMGTYALDANGDPIIAAGQEVVLQTMEFRVDSLLDGQLYTVTTPFGVFADIQANVAYEPDGVTRSSNSDAIKETLVFPGEPVAPGSFDQSGYPSAPYSTVSGSYSGFDVFLTCAGGPQASGFLAPVDVLTGEPLECTISGSPLGPAYDVFRIEGPEVGGGPTIYAELAGTDFAIGLTPWVAGDPSIDMVETNQFLITGHVLPPPPLPVPSASWPLRGVLVMLMIGCGLGAQAWLARRQSGEGASA
jgi:hypothetical protein